MSRKKCRQKKIERKRNRYILKKKKITCRKLLLLDIEIDSVLPCNAPQLCEISVLKNVSYADCMYVDHV